MDVTAAIALYADATRLYQQGNLHRARDVAEQALLSFSLTDPSSSGTHVEDHNTAAPPQQRWIRAASARRRHQLFGNLLLLLASIYTAVRDYAEASRLLATCEGYWREHLVNGGDTEGTRSTSANGTSSIEDDGDDSTGLCRDLDEGLAAVAYNRAVLQLEQLHTPSPSLTSMSPPQDAASQQQMVAAAVLHDYLDEARTRLQHTLGLPRCLLADVLHSCGVCHYYLQDYLAALEAWQQSLAIRVHVRRFLANREEKTIGTAEDAVADTSRSAVEELKVALTLEHVAQVYQLIDGKTAAALKMYDTVAATRERLLGPTHPLYARTLLAKAVLASRLGKVKLARGLLDACDAACTRSGGSECEPAFASVVQRWRDYNGVAAL